MTSYVVEFWPGVIFQVSAQDEEKAIFMALDQHREDTGGWPGGSEFTSNGLDFKAWVRKAE